MRGAWAGKNEMCMRRHKWDAHVQVKLRCACAGQNKMRTRSCKWQQHQQQYLLSTKKFTSVGVKFKLYKKRVQATCKWPWGVSLDRWPFRVKFNKKKVWNKIAYSKNTASAKSIYTHKKRMTEKIYNAYNYIIHIHTHTYIYTYIYTHTHKYI